MGYNQRPLFVGKTVLAKTRSADRETAEQNGTIAWLFRKSVNHDAEVEEGSAPTVSVSSRT
jgi:hypothetical protein